MRRLIRIRMVHSKGELGGGMEAPASLAPATEKLWKQIRFDFSRKDLDFSKAKLYPEGVPAGQLHIPEGVPDTLYYRTMRDLIAKGARVIGVEDIDLLLEHDQMMREVNTILSIPMS